MHLTKHHGLENDFLVLCDPRGVRPVGAAEARAWCDRRTGIGADGLIRATAGTGGADLTMQLFNADGGRAEISGNGIRCLGQAALAAGLVSGPRFTIATDAGLRTLEEVTRPDERTVVLRVDMGEVTVVADEDEWVEGSIVHATRVDAGNPHLVLHVTDLAEVDVAKAGEHLCGLVPGGINVEFVAPTGAGDLDLAVYERGVGVTRACGSGACAAVRAAARWGLTDERATVHMPGGSAHVDLGPPVLLTGPSVLIGAVDLPRPAGGDPWR